MLVPKLLRKKIPDINVGFFLHIPFPSSEIYKILPVAKVISVFFTFKRKFSTEFYIQI
jgi:trehalose-6-phosphate synthase